MTSLSIHTNTGAQAALATLGRVNSALQTVEKQVSTGLKVSDATQNAGVFAVAQGIRTSLAQYDSISGALEDASTLLSVTQSGITQLGNIVTQLAKTLSSLADGTLNDNQRQAYTLELKSEVDSVQTVLEGTHYGGGSILGEDQNGYTLDDQGYLNFTPQPTIVIPTDTSGGSLSIGSINLYSDANGRNGFLSLARISYYVSTNPGSGFSTTFDTYATAVLDYASNQPGYADGSIGSRSEINQQEAIAALSAVGSAQDESSSGQFYSGVFTGALARFQSSLNTNQSRLAVDTLNVQSAITFVHSLSNVNTNALGGLVDANLAQSAAQLTALQTQQQLATQALSISNAQPRNILALFQHAA